MMLRGVGHELRALRVKFRGARSNRLSEMASQKILLVDDEPDVRKLGELCLQKLGKFQVCVAASGPEAIRVAVRERPDLILCDVMMPGLDGPGVLALLRANPDTAEVPLIFLTACCRKEPPS